MAQIPGGTFKMGRDGGPDNEKPEHAETVNAFSVSKHEVTNEQFYEFMAESAYKPSSTDKFLSHWENNRPIKGEEKAAVRWVNMDDVLAFIAWRSKKDGVTYRLPTEKEWEYVARNGAKSNLYPWGDKFDPKCAVVDQGEHDPKAVGTASCPNSWGVYDLIGNVLEWTGSEPWAYPGSLLEIQPVGEKRFMVRGGSAMYKSTGPDAATSTFRRDTAAATRHAALGFRLAQD
jgi:formylglycine-generating enzyme required for sulfatase activity